MSVEIRQACSEDVEVLVQLRLEMRRERENCQLSIPEKDFEELLRKYFSEAVKNGSFVSFVAWENGVPAGCSGLSVVALPPAYGDLSGKKGYITNMYTRKEFRGQGHGTALLNLAEAYFADRGIKTLILTTDTAPDFYRSRGYEQDEAITARNKDDVFVKRIR